jgi:hypothetical protein
MTDIHSCSYYCTRPACVLAQRDELRGRLLQQSERVDKALTNPEPVVDKEQAEPVQAKPVQAEPVAWLSVDPIGERYLTFAKPLDNDPAYPLYLTQQAEPVVVQKLEKLSPDDNLGNPSY